MRSVKCDYCGRDAELVTGAKLFGHLPHLAAHKFWRCVPCRAHVGCHPPGSFHKDDNGRRVWHGDAEPLGRLATAELRRAKTAAHAAFDPLWKSERMTRKDAYAWLASAIGVSPANCHIGMFDLDGCRAVVAAVKTLNSQSA